MHNELHLFMILCMMQLTRITEMTRFRKMNFFIITEDINARMTSSIILKNENGIDRLGVSDTKIDFRLGRARARLRNLFNGDQVLGMG